MNTFLLTLLQATITATVPVVGGFICKFVQTTADTAKKKVENEVAKEMIDEATSAVVTAVAKTNQTYVEALKKSDTFTKENQEEALKMAYNTALTVMRSEVKNFIVTTYGSIEKWLMPKIEEQVAAQKTK